VTCSSCGTENREGARFCRACGAALARTCPNGHPVAADARFCDDCGAAVEGVPATNAASRPAAPEAVAERRMVSVLFADLVGFTTYSEGRDAEDVRELLSRYFDTCRTIIVRYGGTVEKFIGDAVMAVWGAPVATEDDADRAVRAALELVRGVEELGAEVGAADLRARAGVLTGEAAVNVGATGEGMVAGDLVNTASRIQSTAEPGTVLVGEATRRATEASVVYEPAGTHALKGRAEPVLLWRVMRVVAATRGHLRTEGLEAPFVGRDRELRLVKEQFHATGEDGKAHLVSVMGIAGIGKSRLAWEFYKYMEGLLDLFLWHRGRSLSYGEGVAYWALAEMVRGRANILEAEDPSTGAEKLHVAVQQYVPDVEEQRWVEPRLAHLIGLEERAVGEKEDLFAAWRLFFERMAEQRPVVLSFEDLQWADTALLDFIEHLLEWSRNSPIFVLTLARPDLVERRPMWGAGKRNFTSVYLEPLARPAMTELLAGLAPGLPAALTEPILGRAEGVPLYAVETVRMLIDRGLLVQEGAVYRPTGPIGSLDVPETLHALIAARLDGLGPDERHLLQDAAVLGKTFTKQALAAIVAASGDELDGLLASLVRREVLSLQADPRSPERGQYGFLQDLVRTVAYETLSRRERKAKHLAVAAYLEEAWGAEEVEIVEVVASHYLQAYQVDPSAADAPAIKAQARAMLVRAAEHAASLAAAQDALRYFEQVIDLTDEPLEQAEFHERAGQEASKAGRIGEAQVHFEQAIATFDSLALTHPSARVSASLSMTLFHEGRLEEAVERMEGAVAALSSDEPDLDLAVAAAELGRLYYFTGRSASALERVELALSIAESLRLMEVFANALLTKGFILEAFGRIEEGITLAKKALQVAMENSFNSTTLRCRTNLVSSLYNMDRYEEAAENAAQGLELARRVGDRTSEVRLLADAAMVAVATGRWDEAASLGEDLWQAAESSPASIVKALPVVTVWIHRGEMAKAERLLNPFRDAASSMDVQTRSAFFSVMAPLLLAQGRPDEALVAARNASASRGELGITADTVKEGLVGSVEAMFALGDVSGVEAMLGEIAALRPGDLTPYLQAQAARFAARVASIKGEDENVPTAYLAAARSFRERSMPFWLAVTLLEHAEWLHARRRGEESEPLAAEAREIFERLKAQPWLERLEAVMPRVSATAG